MHFIEVLARVSGRTPNLQMRPMQPGDMRSTSADIEATTRVLGWRPTTSIERGAAADVRVVPGLLRRRMIGNPAWGAMGWRLANPSCPVLRRKEVVLTRNRWRREPSDCGRSIDDPAFLLHPLNRRRGPLAFHRFVFRPIRRKYMTKGPSVRGASWPPCPCRGAVLDEQRRPPSASRLSCGSIGELIR